MAKKKKPDDGTAEEKIKKAARKLFTEKGFDAVKTRDIAAEAGINLALLNYYFRSKQKLFDIVMVENFEQFIQQLMPVLGNENLSSDVILQKVTEQYIEMLTKNPDLPFFIMSQMRSDSSKLEAARNKMMGVRGSFIKQFEKALKTGKLSETDLAHLMTNFMGLIIFPFVAKPMLMRVNSLNEKQFLALMEERKKLIPIWLKAIMTTK